MGWRGAASSTSPPAARAALLHAQQRAQGRAVDEFQGRQVHDHPRTARRDRCRGTVGARDVQLPAQRDNNMAPVHPGARLGTHYQAAFLPEQPDGDWTQQLANKPASAADKQSRPGCPPVPVGRGPGTEPAPGPERRGRCERWRRSCPLSESRELPLARSAGLPGAFLAGYASAEVMAQLRQLGGRHTPHAPGVVGAAAAGGGAGGGRSWLHRAGFGAPGRPCEQVRPAGRPGHGVAAGRWLQIPGGRPA